MATIILKYKLKPGVTRADFEHWVKTTDQPVMRGLTSVAASPRSRGVLPWRK